MLSIFFSNVLSQGINLTFICAFLSKSNENKVTDLIDFNKVCWKEDVIRHSLLHYETEAILQIPMNLIRSKDKFIWNFILNSIYTVKLAYKVGMIYMSLIGRNNEQSIVNQEAKLQNSINRLLVQFEVRMFLWRVVLNIFSIRNICRRGLSMSIVVSNLKMTSTLYLNVIL